MKWIKTIILSVVTLSFMASFSQCSKEQRLEKKAPMEFGEVYYKKNAQAVRDLEPSLTLYIPIQEDSIKIELDSVYFKGKSAKLVQSTQNLYFSRFIMKPAYTEDIILSSDMAEEHKNKLPKRDSKIPFELKPNECIISYKMGGETKYYKISNIKEKRLKEVPMSPRNKR
jgi:hypothetical protein